MRVTLFVGVSLALGCALSLMVIERSTAQNVWATQSEDGDAGGLTPTPPAAPAAPTAPQPAVSATYLQGFQSQGGAAFSGPSGAAISGPSGAAISVFRTRDTDPNRAAIRDLLMKYRQTEDNSERQTLRAEIEKLTDDSFRKMMQKRRSQLDAAKQRLAEIEQRLDARDELAEQIIERRVADLLNEPDLLEWDFGGTPATGLPAITFPGQSRFAPFTGLPPGLNNYPAAAPGTSASRGGSLRADDEAAIYALRANPNRPDEGFPRLTESEFADRVVIEAALARLEEIKTQLQTTDPQTQIETLERFLQELKAAASTDSEDAASDNAAEYNDATDEK